MTAERNSLLGEEPATPEARTGFRSFGRVAVGGLVLLAVAGVAWVSGVPSPTTPDSVDNELFGESPGAHDHEYVVRHLGQRLAKFGIDLDDIDFNEHAMADYIEAMPGQAGSALTNEPRRK